MKCGNDYCKKEVDRLYVLRGPAHTWDLCINCYLRVTALIERFITSR
jgi:hypothetical protein